MAVREALLCKLLPNFVIPVPIASMACVLRVVAPIVYQTPQCGYCSLVLNIDTVGYRWFRLCSNHVRALSMLMKKSERHFSSSKIRRIPAIGTSLTVQC